MAFSPEYLAGFFDGEGYVYMYANSRQMTCIVGIANTHFRVLDELRKEFGGDLYPKKRRSVNHSQGWELRWYGDNARHILEVMLPHLFVKKAEVEHILEKWFPLVRRTGRGHGWTKEEVEIRAAAINDFKRIRAAERKVNQFELIN